jgi:signal transduction histidine kinase
VLVLAFLALGAVLWVAPKAWGVATRRDLMEAFNESVTTEPVQIGAALEALPVPGPGFPENAEAVASLLEAHPLLIGVIARKDQRVHIRDGSRLLQETGTPRTARYLAWARAAEAHRNETRFDPPIPPEEPPTFLLLDPVWTWIVQWRPGSPEAEAFLLKALGRDPKVRAGLARNGQRILADPDASLDAAFSPPHLQVSPEGPEADWTVVWTGTVLGPHWVTIIQPWPERAREWDAKVLNRTWMARLVGLGTLGLLAAGLALRRQNERVQALEADRLAALTHSLKTPLAIHKLRCETLRMGRLDGPRAAEELMRLGQEVDELTRLIERGLIAHHRGEAQQALEAFGPAWVEDVAESLRPALEAAGRPLRLELAGTPGLAHLPSLQSALQTLLENAYYHGQGEVALRSWGERNRLQIEVSDQGAGLDPVSLDALGKPFQRIRLEGEEGFRQEGQGLGLALLLQVARQEGWGLAFSSEQGRGFFARMELPLFDPASSQSLP